MTQLGHCVICGDPIISRTMYRSKQFINHNQITCDKESCKKTRKKQRDQGSKILRSYRTTLRVDEADEHTEG